MNPLTELQAIIESLLFRIGDEQMTTPEYVSLVLVVDGKPIQYTIQNGQKTSVDVSVFVHKMED